MQHAAYLFVAPDNGVEFAFARLVHEVAGVFRQRLIGIFRPLRGCFLPAAQFLDGLPQGLLGEAGIFQNLRRRALGEQEGEQEGFERHELVAHFLRLSGGAAEGIVGLAVEIRFAAAHARQALQLAVEGAAEHRLLHARLAEEKLRDVLACRQHARKQMGAADGLMP